MEQTKQTYINAIRALCDDLILNTSLPVCYRNVAEAVKDLALDALSYAEVKVIKEMLSQTKGLSEDITPDKLNQYDRQISALRKIGRPWTSLMLRAAATVLGFGLLVVGVAIGLSTLGVTMPTILPVLLPTVVSSVISSLQSVQIAFLGGAMAFLGESLARRGFFATCEAFKTPGQLASVVDVAKKHADVVSANGAALKRAGDDLDRSMVFV